jgi:hypothetical protein
LVIQASERQPAALLSAGNSIYLLDWEGYVMERLTNATIRDKDFPCITGISSDDVQVGEKIYNAYLYRALDLTHVLKERNPELYAKLSEVQIATDPLSHMESITAHLRGGMEVRFGDNNPIEMLPAFEVWANTIRAKGADPYNMAYVDLRFKDRVFHMDKDTAIGAEAGVLEQLEAETPVQTGKSEKGANKGKDGTKPGKSVSKTTDEQSNPRTRNRTDNDVESRSTEGAGSGVGR